MAFTIRAEANAQSRWPTFSEDDRPSLGMGRGHGFTSDQSP
jgi:hypothetical protein